MSVDNSKNISRTDWAALAAMSDDDIDYSDIPPLTEEFFKNATLRIPASQAHNWVELEPDIIKWFQSQGADYKALINAVLQRHITENSSQGDSSTTKR